MTTIETLEDLMAAATAYQRSMTIFAALRLGVFEALAGDASGEEALARRLGADPDRLRILLCALVSMGLLRKRGKGYGLSAVAREFLAGGPRSKASILLHHLDGWGDWGRLEETIRGGRKGPGRRSDFQENFIRGMEDNARERASDVAERFPLRPGERVLDLGGGPGTYAVEWARRYPEARLTILDIPETLRVTRKILREKGMEKRVALIEGDFLADPVGGPYDFVWISQILHAFSAKQCRFILERVRGALAPGGRVAVQEFLLAGTRTAPPGPAMFSVHMVAVTEGGRAYTAQEVASMLRESGFRKVSATKPDPGGVGILTAV